MRNNDPIPENQFPRGALPTEGRTGVQVIRRASEILRAIAQHRGGLRFTELVGLVDLPKVTTHRIVRALVDEHFVVIDSLNRLQVGPGISALADASFSGTVARLRPLLLELRAELKETVELSVLDGSSVRTVEQVGAIPRQHTVSPVGLCHPIHCTASGKAYLAVMPPAEVAALLPAHLDAVTPNTITDRGWLDHQLAISRFRGISIDRQEHSLGVSAVGWVISDAAGTFAAISVAVPETEFDERFEELSDAVRTTCAAATVLLVEEG